MKNKKPNILLIMTDQMRGDCMGIAGHPDVKTPFLDTLAKNGVYYRNAYTACPSCIPARAALLTGMSQEKHGRVGYKDGVAWTYKNMLPEVLSNNGYATKLVGKMHVHPPRNHCGFQSVTLHDGYLHYYRNEEIQYNHHQLVTDDYFKWLKQTHGNDADITNTGIEANSWVARPWIYDEMSHPTNWVVTKSLNFLQERERTKPFFLMASFVRPHPPFDAPQSYFDMYNRMDLCPPVIGEWADMDGYKEHGRIYDSPYACSDKELQRQAMVGYYACITHIDHQIGRLMQGLMADGSYDDTLIIFISDHGELLFDHHMFRKIRPYQGSVHIPFIVSAGKNICDEAINNKTSDRIVELRDVMPSILDFSDIAIPETVDGQNILSDEFNRTYLHGEHEGGDLSNHYIVTKTDKYIWFSQTGVEQYFHLENDPKEEHNLINDAKYKDRINALKKHLHI